MAVYRRQTEPLLGYYRGRKLLHSIDAVGTVQEVTERLFAAVGRLAAIGQ
jgi:adenylate kinase family enzyme